MTMNARRFATATLGSTAFEPSTVTQPRAHPILSLISAMGRFMAPLSVPKILTLFIPEILSHPAIAGRARTLPVPPVGRPVGRRGEDVGNVKASRSRDLAQSRSSEDRSGPFVGSFPVLGEAHRGRSSGRACR